MQRDHRRTRGPCEITDAFHRYERELIEDDLATMDALSHDARTTVRFGVGEVLHGIDEIWDFRNGRSGSPQRRLGGVEIITYGSDIGVAHAEFFRDGSDRRGRQTQTSARFADGWKILSAHVSLEGSTM